VPFLVARSGRRLAEFGRWVRPRRPIDFLLDMLKCTTMSNALTKEWLEQLARPDEDPKIEARQRLILQTFLDARPQVRQELVEEGRLEEARAMLRRVLGGRRLALSPSDDARIDACADLATLERWHDQAVLAATSVEALR
jgi:hypothetical protein